MKDIFFAGHKVQMLNTKGDEYKSYAVTDEDDGTVLILRPNGEFTAMLKGETMLAWLSEDTYKWIKVK